MDGTSSGGNGQTDRLDKHLVLRRSAYSESQCIDFPGYEQLLCRPGTRARSWRRNQTMGPAAFLLHATSSAPAPITLRGDHDGGGAAVPLTLQPPVPPGLSLGSMAGARPFDDSAARAITSSQRDSVDGAAGAEMLLTCTAADLSPWVCPPLRTPASSNSSVGPACPAPPAPGPSSRPSSSVPTRPTSPGQPWGSRYSPSFLAQHRASHTVQGTPAATLQFDSDIQLARIQARYAALDARREIRYEPFSGAKKGSSNGSGGAGRASCGMGRGTPGGMYDIQEWVVSDGSSSGTVEGAAAGASASAGAGGGSGASACVGGGGTSKGGGGGGGVGSGSVRMLDADERVGNPSPSAWSFLAVLTAGRGARRASTGTTCGAGVASGGNAANGANTVSFADASRADASSAAAGVNNFGGSFSLRASWRRCQQLLWPRPARRRPGSRRAPHGEKRGQARGGGSGGCGGFDTDASAGDDGPEALEPLSRTRDSRVVHRVRLGMDVRPPEFERSLSVFSVARDEDGQLLLSGGSSSPVPPLASVPPSSWTSIPSSAPAPALGPAPPPGALHFPAVTGTTSRSATATAVRKWLLRWRGQVAESKTGSSGGGGGGATRAATSGISVSAGRDTAVEELFMPIVRACEDLQKQQQPQRQQRQQQQRPSTVQGVMDSGMVLQTVGSLPSPAAAAPYRIDVAVAARGVRCLSQPEPLLQAPAAAAAAATLTEAFRPRPAGPGAQQAAVAPVASSGSGGKGPRSFRSRSIWPVSPASAGAASDGMF